MPNSDHLSIIDKGVTAWNKWRHENAAICPDLSNANLNGAFLNWANLSKANLSGTNLIAADLRDVDLSGANLREAKLSGAGLFNATLKYANLSKADLCRANLARADMRRTNLNGANLTAANLERAILEHATLTAACLREVDLSFAVLTNADLTHAHLNRANLAGANLNFANLCRANLTAANLQRASSFAAIFSAANLSGANLKETQFQATDFTVANLREVDLSGANLSNAYFYGADLSRANLNYANLSRANLATANLYEADISKAIFVETDLRGANLIDSRVYGISAWDIVLDNTKQAGLIITKLGDPVITVDDIEVAQFLYFILTNKKIRNVINTVANKAVLILGRFTAKRKEVLGAIATKLKAMDLVPIIFDFKKSEEQDIIETVITLASLSKFIIADVTDARVIADELRSFVPNFSIPVVPIFQSSKKEPKPYASLYTLYPKYPWVFKPVLYKSKEHLIKILSDQVIKPAEMKRLEIANIMKGNSK